MSDNDEQEVPAPAQQPARRPYQTPRLRELPGKPEGFELPQQQPKGDRDGCS
jgi:hypothetical protein